MCFNLEKDFLVLYVVIGNIYLMCRRIFMFGKMFLLIKLKRKIKL